MSINFSSSVSGINASSLQMAVSANNVAKRPVIGAKAQRVVFSTQETGGVNAHVQTVPRSQQLKAHMDEFNPNNINLAQEFVTQHKAYYGFMANLRALNTSINTFSSLLDVTV